MPRRELSGNQWRRIVFTTDTFSHKALDPNVWRRYGCVDVGAFRQGLLDSINPEDDIPELCTTYLRELCAQAKKSMRKTLGSAFDRMHKHWVVTVPALWDPAARELIKTCAADAGFEDAEIISEPEAAASYALRDNAHLSDEEAWLGEGDSFVVCDGERAYIPSLPQTILIVPWLTSRFLDSRRYHS